MKKRFIPMLLTLVLILQAFTGVAFANDYMAGNYDYEPVEAYEAVEKIDDEIDDEIDDQVIDTSVQDNLEGTETGNNDGYLPGAGVPLPGEIIDYVPENNIPEDDINNLPRNYDDDSLYEDLSEWEEYLRSLGIDPNAPLPRSQLGDNVIDLSGDTGIAAFGAFGFEAFNVPGEITRYNTLIIDVSGSMAGRPIQVAREATQRFVNDVIAAPGRNYIAIVAFGTHANVRIPFTLADESNRAALTNAVNGLVTAGSTNMFGGLNVAQQQLLNQIDLNRPNVFSNVLLMSDGLPNAGGIVAQRDDGPFRAPQSNWRFLNGVYHAAREIAADGHNMYSLAFFHNVTGPTLALALEFFKPRLSSWWPGDDNYDTMGPAIGNPNAVTGYIPRPRGFHVVINPEDLEFEFGEILDDIFQGPLPIIVVPGIAGSSLADADDGDVLWVSSWDLFPPVTRIPRLSLDSTGASHNNISPRQGVYGVSDHPFVGIARNQILPYERIMADLRATFQDRSVYFFPYDWRLCNTENARLLREFIINNNYTQVDVVAHSMGGLVVSHLIADGHASLVRTLITIGTPYLGAPRVPYIFSTGNFVSLFPEHMDTALRGVSSHMHSAYQLLPYRYTDLYIAVVNLDWRYGVQRTYQRNSHAFIRNTLNMRNYDDNNVPGSVRQTFLDRSRNFMGNLFNTDGSHVITNVRHYVIVGSGQETIRSVTFDPRGNHIHNLNFNRLGDGTVPHWSATINNTIDYSRFNYGHTELMWQPRVINRVISVLSGYTPPTHADPADTRGIIVIRIASPVETTVSLGGEDLNADNRLTDFGTLHFIGYEGDIELFALSADNVHDVLITGTGDGTMTFSISYFEADGTFIEERVFVDVPITHDTIITTNTDQTVATELLLDLYGNGEVAILDPDHVILEDRYTIEPLPQDPDDDQPPVITQAGAVVTGAAARTPSRRTAARRESTARTRVARDPGQAAQEQEQVTPAIVDRLTFELTADVPDGSYEISVTGLPNGVTAPDYVDVADGGFVLELAVTELAQAGDYTLAVNIYDEEGNILYTTGSFTITIAGQQLPEQEPPIPAPQPEPPAPQVTQTVIRLTIDDAEFTVNGMSRQADAAPFIDEAYNRTMVPLRLVAEALGAMVDWNAETRIVTITSGAQVITLTLDEPLPGGMGVPAILNDRTFVPIAYVAQMLGADVQWNAETRAVYIRQ